VRAGKAAQADWATKLCQGYLGGAIVCDGYLEIQLSKENFVSNQRVIRRLVDGLPEEEFTPRLIDTCWAKGAAIMLC